MKKLVSLLLTVCICLLLVFALVGCAGEKNAWQSYLGAKGWNVSKTEAPVERNVGIVGANSDGYSFKGGLSIQGRGNGEFIEASAIHKESHISATDGVTDTKYDDYLLIDYMMSFNSKKNTLYVNVANYYYYTTSVGVEVDGDPDWRDGYYYNSDGYGSSFIDMTFDMSGYFANGELTVEDISREGEFDAEAIRNKTGIAGDVPYTERNAAWDTQALESIIRSVNDFAALIDAYMKANPV